MKEIGTKAIGTKAIVLNNKGNIHCFKKETEVIFLGMEGTDLYKFENKETGINQYLTKENFKWID